MSGSGRKARVSLTTAPSPAVEQLERLRQMYEGRLRQLKAEGAAAQEREARLQEERDAARKAEAEWRARAAELEVQRDGLQDDCRSLRHELVNAVTASRTLRAGVELLAESLQRNTRAELKCWAKAGSAFPPAPDQLTPTNNKWL